MTCRPSSVLAASVVLTAALLGACGDGGSGRAAEGRPSIVVTTSLLGDVVRSMLGDAAAVTVVMPVGADPHEFQASAQQAAAMREADLLVVNGADFEEGLLDVIGSAEADGVPVHEAIAAVEALAGDEHGHDDDAGGGNGEDGHGHDGADPHFFTDPARMAVAAEAILEALISEVPALDTPAVRGRAAAYLDELAALDAEVESLLSGIPDDERVLVTNHETLGYFADRYGFEVAGVVIPGGTTGGASAAELADLVDVVREAGVDVVFADTSSPDDLARTLAAEVGDVDVVELFSESLGEAGSGGETYIEMMRTNATRIAEALA